MPLYISAWCASVRPCRHGGKGACGDADDDPSRGERGSRAATAARPVDDGGGDGGLRVAGGRGRGGGGGGSVLSFQK